MAEIIAENVESATGGAVAASTENKEVSTSTSEEQAPASEDKPEKKSQAQIDEEEKKKKEQKELNMRTLQSLAGVSATEESAAPVENATKPAAVAEVKNQPVNATATV